VVLTYQVYVPEHVDDSCSKLKGTAKEINITAKLHVKAWMHIS